MGRLVLTATCPQTGAAEPVHLRMLLFVGNGGQMSLVQKTSAVDIAAALDQVGARLKRVRTHRRTLTGVARATGSSKSTMSRLENGQRRPALELLLALSHAYRVPHWCGSTGAEPAEILSVFGRPGERRVTR